MTTRGVMVQRREFILASMAAAVSAAHARGRPIPEWRPTETLLRSLPRMLELASVPGVAVALIGSDGTWARGFGRLGGDGSARVDDETVFEAASLGKPLVACAALRLAEQGRLDLARPLYDYVQAADFDSPLARRITTEHVLSQTTGLPNWRDDPGPLVPAEAPGQAFRYSGEAYFYLQRVLERVSGVPFARLMQDEVLQPLGMTSSSWVWRPAFDARMAVGHDAQGEPREMYAAIGRAAAAVERRWKRPLLEWTAEEALRAAPLINPQWPALPLFAVPNAACSLFTTARDYSRFLARLVAAPPAPGLALAPATMKAMCAPRVTLNSALSWSLGWGVQRDQSGEVLWQWGANMSFRNFVVADRANGLAIAVFTSGANGPRVYERIITAVTGHDHPAFLWI